MIAKDISAFSTTMIFFISAAETITLDDAKEKVQTIIRRLDQRDITGFRNWVTSVISENVYSEGIIVVFVKYA
jgi:division protein CdvB (Snf7/Vps24/ESCRT-III family)